jgi:hypothetical protein
MAVGAGDRDPVGGDHHPIGVHVRQADLLGLRQGVAHAKGVCGEQVETFVQVPLDAELKTGDGARGHARTAVRKR